MPPPVPALWQTLCGYLDLGEVLTQRTWHALTRSQRPGPQQLRHAVLLADARYPVTQAAGLIAFRQASANPQQLVGVLEVLHEETLLSWAEAQQSIDHVLVKVDATGQWQTRQHA